MPDSRDGIHLIFCDPFSKAIHDISPFYTISDHPPPQRFSHLQAGKGGGREKECEIISPFQGEVVEL